MYDFPLSLPFLLRRIHSHIYQYTSQQVYASDQAWRQQCQMCRFVDPVSYHVPPKYARNAQPTTLPQRTSPPPRSVSSGRLSPIPTPAGVHGGGHGPLPVPPVKRASDKNLAGHFEAEVPQAQAPPRPPSPQTTRAPAASSTSSSQGHTHSHSHGHVGSAQETEVRASSPHSTGSTASSTRGPRSRRNTASTESVSETNDNSPYPPTSGAQGAGNAVSAASAGLQLHSPEDTHHHDHAHSHHHGEESTHHHASSAQPPAPSVPASASESGSGTPKTPTRLKMRLVSDDSTIYKTCFHENHAPGSCPDNKSSVMSPGSPVPPPPPGPISMLRASFQGLTSPSSGALRKGMKDDSILNTPTKFVKEDPAGEAPSVGLNTGPRGPDEGENDYFNAPISEYSPERDERGGVSHATSNSLLDNETDDPANTISSYRMGGLDPHPPTTSPGAPQASTLDQLAGIKGIPLQPAPGDKNFGPPKGRLGSSTSGVSRRKTHNSSSPRSYLTANALRANDRALTAPSCTCKMCTTFAAAARLQRLPKYSEGQYGIAYARSSRVMSFLITASTPGVSLSSF